jgi:hypothetical protein
MSGLCQFTIVVTEKSGSWEAVGLGLDSDGKNPYEAVRNWNFELAEESIAYVLKFLEDAET